MTRSLNLRPLLHLLVPAAAAMALGCGGGEPDSAPAPPAAPRVSHIQEGYVGSAACADCHQPETAEWEKSSHRLMFREGAAPAYAGTTPPAFESDALHVLPTEVNVQGADARPAMRIEKGGAVGTFTIDAVIGGKRMEAYATRLADGAYVLLPLYYQVDRQAFVPYSEGTCGIEALRPFEPQLWQSYIRVWNHRCIDCHVTAGDIGFDATTETYDTTFVDPGIGCEACHGPGQAHVDSARAGGSGDTGDIVNPASLTPTESAEICASCHAFSFPFETRWGGNRPYRPGDDYSRAFLPLLRSRESRPFTVLTHADHTPAVGVMEYQGLMQSLCALEGGATCTSCHLAHGGDAPHGLRAAPGGTELCAGCHQGVVDQGREHTHHDPDRPGGACLDCHMPPTVEAAGTRLASHAIDIPLPVNNRDYGVPDACTLCHGERGNEWATQEYERLWGSPEDHRRRRLTRAFAEKDEAALRELLQDTSEADLLRADAAAAVAIIGGRDAAPLLLAALENDPSLTVRRHAADLLGSIGGAGVTSLQERIDRLNALDAAGVPQGLRRAHDQGPPELRLAAASSLARLGADDGIQRLEALRDDALLNSGYRLHFALAKYYLQNQRSEEAMQEYQAVLDMTPNNLSAIHDLGFLYFSERRYREARDLWLRGLVLNPFNETLKLNVHLAEDGMRGEQHQEGHEASAEPGSGGAQ